jgi:nitrogen fixation/metabolism regulation signal transduction histidine kinase
MDTQMKIVKKHDERKNYLINPKFQLSIVGIFIGIALIINMINFLSITYSFHEIIAAGNQANLPENSPFFKFIHSQENHFTSIFLWTSLISATTLVIFGILLSHKIAGPIYRINEDLKAMTKDGKLKTLHFRKGDFFVETTETFNNFIKSLENKDH